MSAEQGSILHQLQKQYLHSQPDPTPAQIQRQIQENAQENLTQAENGFRAKGHRFKPRRESTRNDTKPGAYNRQILGIEE